MSVIIRRFLWRTAGLLGFLSVFTTSGFSNPVASQPAALDKSLKSGLLAAARTNPNVLTIRIQTSRNQIVPDTPMGISADLTNDSEAPIYLRQRDIQLVMPPEYYGGIGLTSGESWFPTEYCEQKNPLICSANLAGISIRPGETYRVFWTRQKLPQSDDKWYRRTWDRFRDLINFVPGEYPIAVDSKYWDAPGDFGNDRYHTAVQSMQAQIVAPQGTILWGAALGGVIFTILMFIRGKENSPLARSSSNKASIAVIGSLQIVGSILLSVIATILLSRIEQTQFFVKITVSDFWGAIAIGFLANYGGWKLLDKMAGGPGNESNRGLAASQTRTLAPGASPSH